MARSYADDAPARRVPLDVTLHGEPESALTVVVRDADGRQASAEWAGPLQLARKHPLDEATVREQFSRLGETPFFLDKIHLELPQPVMVPKSVLNELRRTVVGRLAELRARVEPQD